MHQIDMPMDCHVSGETVRMLSEVHTKATNVAELKDSFVDNMK